jgi:hypothetical protein
MFHFSKVIIWALALAALAGCVKDTGMSGGSLTSRAEAACMERARATSVRDPFVISAEYSEANTLVTVGGSQADRYRCLSSNDGAVAEFSLL